MITPDNIFSFFLSKFFINILDGIFCLLIGIILYSPKIKLKRLIVASILIGLISSTGFILANYYLSSIIVIFTYLVSFFIVPLIIKLTLEIAYFKAFLTYILLLVFELIPGLTLPYILDSIGFSTNKMLSDPLTLFFLNLIVLIMSLIFLPLLKWIKNITYFRKEVSKKHIILIITLIVSNLIIVIMNYTFLDNYVAYYNLERDLTNYFITVFLILTNFVITVSISLKISKLGVKEQELENQVFYNNILMNITNDLRRANHNHNNVISSITGIAESENWNGLKEYLKELVATENKMHSTKLISLTNIKNGAILGILNSKSEKARECDVELNINVYGEINEFSIPISLSQFCEVLGILLDNAIEAAADSLEKFTKVTITSENKNISFRIENSYKDKPDIAKMFLKDWSTKGEGRGLGLWIVNNIKRKHKSLILNTFVEDNFVQQELIVG